MSGERFRWDVRRTREDTRQVPSTFPGPGPVAGPSGGPEVSETQTLPRTLSHADSSGLPQAVESAPKEPIGLGDSLSSRPVLRARTNPGRPVSTHPPTTHSLPAAGSWRYLRASDVLRAGARFPGRPELRQRRARSAPVPGASESPARRAGPRSPAPRLEAAEWLVGVTCRGGAGARPRACTSAGRGAAGRCRASAAGKVQRGAQR